MRRVLYGLLLLVLLCGCDSREGETQQAIEAGAELVYRARNRDSGTVTVYRIENKDGVFYLVTAWNSVAITQVKK